MKRSQVVPFLHRFERMSFLSSSESERHTEEERQQHRREARPAPHPRFLCDPGTRLIRYHSLQEAWDTLELVLLFSALQINVPVSISFCRSTPFREQKIPEALVPALPREAAQ